MTCLCCKAELPENAKFCPQCGNPVTNKTVQPNGSESTSAGHPAAYCKNCGMPLTPNITVCPKCNFSVGSGTNYCQNCGNPVDPQARICVKCGYDLKKAPYFIRQKSKVIAGILGILLGGFGAHNFYLGYYDKAIVQLILTVVGIFLTCFVIGTFLIAGASIWGLVEGIMILTGQISTDSQGVPLMN